MGVSGVNKRGRSKRAPPKTRNLLSACKYPTNPWLIERHVNHDVRLSAQACVDILLGLSNGNVGTFIWANGHGEMETVILIFNRDLVNPGVIVNFRTLEHAENGLRGGGVEDQCAREIHPL